VDCGRVGYDAVQSCTKETTCSRPNRRWEDNIKMPGGGKGLQGPVEVQSNMGEALRGYNPWRARHRNETLGGEGGRVPGTRSAGGQAITKQTSWGRA
jgi:hypothetical protein